MKKGVKLWKINQIHSRSFFTFIAWSHYFSDRSRTDNYLHKATCRYKLEQTSLPVPSHPLNMNWVKQYTSILFTAAVVSLALISLKYTESKNSKPVFKPRQPATAPPPLDFWCSKREHQPCPFDPSFFQAARLCAIYAALCLSPVAISFSTRATICLPYMYFLSACKWLECMLEAVHAVSHHTSQGLFGLHN